MAKSIDIDPSRCVCCYACVVACKDLHNPEVAGDAPAMRRAFRAESPQGGIFCASVGCMHCADAPCLAACRLGAITRDAETGFVVVDASRCVGCGRCKKACPMGVPQIVGRTMYKCDGCVQRVKAGRLPLCVQTCPSGALMLRDGQDTAQHHAARLTVKFE